MLRKIPNLDSKVLCRDNWTIDFRDGHTLHSLEILKEHENHVANTGINQYDNKCNNFFLKIILLHEEEVDFVRLASSLHEVYRLIPGYDAVNVAALISRQAIPRHREWARFLPLAGFKSILYQCPHSRIQLRVLASFRKVFDPGFPVAWGVKPG